MMAVAVLALGCGPFAAAAPQPQQAPGATGLDQAPAGTHDIVYYRLTDAQPVKF